MAESRLGVWHGDELGEFDGGGGGCCTTPADIEAGRTWSWGGGARFNYALLVVPDGVARVTVTANNRVLTVVVHGNIAAFKTPPIDNPDHIANDLVQPVRIDRQAVLLGQKKDRARSSAPIE